MKKIAWIITGFLIFILFFACETAPPRQKSAPQARVLDSETIRKIVDSMDYRVLLKIDQGSAVKYVVAVVGDAQEIKDVTINLGELFQTAINKTGRVITVDRKNLDTIIEEQNLVLSGMLSDESSLEIGEIAGADFMLVSSVVSASTSVKDKTVYDLLEANVTVQAKLLDVSTGEVSLSLSAKGEAKDKRVTDADGNLVSGVKDFNNLYAQAVQSAVNNLIPKFLRKFPALGFVYQVGADSVVTDLGSGSGVKMGDVIAFIKKGEPRYHKVTRKLIAYEYQYLGYGKVTELKGSESTVKLIEGTGNIGEDSIAILIR